MALACLALSLVGIGLCVYLGVVHVALLRGEIIGGAACGTAGTIFNCHAVTGSPMASVLGFPLVFVGLLGYLAILSLAFIAWQFPDWASQALVLLAGLSLLFVVLDLVLLYVMLVRIGYLCRLCLATYLVNIVLLVLALRGVARPFGQVLRQIPGAIGAFLPRPRLAVVWVFWGIVGTGLVGTLAVHAASVYLSEGPPGHLQQQMTNFVKQQSRVVVDTQGDPLVGTPGGSVRLTEFSDFLCPSCQRASRFNPIFLGSHRGSASFVFKHFPLDTTCNTSIKRMVHSGACQIAAATECAHEQGKFWEFHDLIFKVGSTYKPSNVEGDAQRLGLDMDVFRSCVSSGRGLEAVKRDVAEGIRLGVTSTPTYIINGLRLAGILTPHAFEALLEAERQLGP